MVSHHVEEDKHNTDGATSVPPPSQTFQVSIQVPTPPVNSEDRHEITVVLTPKKLHSISETPPHTPSTQSPYKLNPTPGRAAHSPLRGEPSHSAGTDVFGPVETPVTARRGRKEKRWYVVIRGREIGVFFDYWADVEPFIKENGKFIYGARFRRTETMQRAQALYAEAQAHGETRLL